MMYGRWLLKLNNKANMNSYIQLQTAAIFFSIEPLSKTGYWLGVCHGWFHLQGANWRCKERELSENNKIKKSCPQWDLNPGPPAY